jgi:hypothetical protein
MNIKSNLIAIKYFFLMENFVRKIWKNGEKSVMASRLRGIILGILNEF